MFPKVKKNTVGLVEVVTSKGSVFGPVSAFPNIRCPKDLLRKLVYHQIFNKRHKLGMMRDVKVFCEVSVSVQPLPSIILVPQRISLEV